MNKSANNSSSSHPHIVHLYRQYLSDGDSVRWITSVAGCYSLETLLRLTFSSQHVVRQSSVFALGMIANRDAIDVLGPRLGDSDRRVRLLADDAIKAIEIRSIPLRGRLLLERSLVQIESNKMRSAKRTADQIIISYPQSGDGYCRRALANFNLGRITEAMHDCRQCIALSPYCYMAYVGLGQCLLEADEARAALDAFRDAVAIYPDLDTVRIQIKRLERMFRETT